MPEPTNRIALKRPTKAEPVGEPVVQLVKRGDVDGRTWHEYIEDGLRTPSVVNS